MNNMITMEENREQTTVRIENERRKDKKQEQEFANEQRCLREFRYK